VISWSRRIPHRKILILEDTFPEVFFTIENFFIGKQELALQVMIF
jgi:hypothetical protein